MPTIPSKKVEFDPDIPLDEQIIFENEWWIGTENGEAVTIITTQ